MEDMYVKPGNQERGWNDPPQFSYGLQVAHSTQKNLLNKRAAPGTGTPPMTPPIHSPLAPPPVGVSAPPRSSAGPPPPCVATPPSAGSVGSHSETISSQSETEPDVEVVLSVLNQALAACRHSVKEQVCNDVAKRLHLLEDSWRGGRLSLPVRRRMDTLSQELKLAHWDTANEIHRSLMVDHVAEVSQWMVGVKRLIAETRNLSPEILEFLQKPTEPVEKVQDSVESNEEPAEPTEEPVEPTEEPAELTREPAEPTEELAEPVQD